MVRSGMAAVKIATDEDGCILSISAEFEDAKAIARDVRRACARGDAQDRGSCVGAVSNISVEITVFLDSASPG